MSMRRQSGLTIIELMIAITISLILMLGITALFIQTKRSAAQNERIQEIQENGRFAMHVLAEDLKHAAFFGGILSAGQIAADDASGGTLASSGTDCGDGSSPWGWMFDAANGSLEFLETAADSSAHLCIESASFKPNTDILAIKRARGEVAGTLENGTVYLRSNNQNGCLWKKTASNSAPANTTACPTSDVQDWPYLAHVYYVRSWSVANGDGIPALCRKHLTGDPPAMKTQCLAEGIEHFHIDFGIDDDEDGYADYWEGDPSKSELERAVSARIYVLTRSREPSQGLNNQKTYRLGTHAAITVNDDYHRRVYSTTVILRNPANLATM